MSETATASRSAIRTFVAYRLVSRGYFHLSVLFVFLLNAELSVVEATIVLAAFGLAMTAMTPVTPRLLARLGAGRALVVGELLKAAGLVALALAGSSVSVALAAQVVNAVGFAMALSADTAVINQLADAPTVRALQASTQSLMFIALLVSGVAGGVLYQVDPRWPLYAGAATAVAASLLAAALSRGTAASATGAPTSAGSGRQRLLPPEIRWITYYVTTRGFMLGTFVGLLPYLIFRNLGVSVLNLTLLLAGYSLAAFLSARYVSQLMKSVSAPTFAAVTAVTLLLALLVFAVSSSLVLVTVAMVLLGAASGCVRPATMVELANAAKDSRSGTIPGWLVSRMEGLFGICNAGVILVGGIVIYYWSFTTAMLVLCVAYVLFLLAAELLIRGRQRDSADVDQIEPQRNLSV